MAKGAISKIEITKKILEMFEGSFTYNGGKEIRIPLIEEGEEIQISFENPLLDELGRKKTNNFITFSPCGNGAFSKNINSGLTFQDDVVCLFENTLNYESDNKKTKRLVKNSTKKVSEE